MEEVQNDTSGSTIVQSDDFIVIGIGASAGGLEPIKAFFDKIPSNILHSFVLVQHLSPDHESFMRSLLEKHTELPIIEVNTELSLEPGHIYIFPNDKNVVLKAGMLVPVDRKERGELNLPIDLFFQSLAEDKGDKSVGIILSGTGSDGTRGIRSIKEAGGFLLVQDPHEAQFDGMPRSAINTGLIDAVLPITRLPIELITYLSYPKDKRNIYSQIVNDSNTLERILGQLENATNLSFKEYKAPTLARRLERRLAFNKCDTLKDYLYFLVDNEKEPEILKKEFLIGVTSFFRDDEAWDVLKSDAMTTLIQNRVEKSEPVRFWSIACSTGEEAYSLAIQVHETLEELGEDIDVKIFATDVNEDSLNFARKGEYPSSILADISPDLLAKHFLKNGGDKFRVNERLRRMIVFSQHNILSDPPFNDMDLILCRNLLIYLNIDAQNAVLKKAHYALNKNGFLMLGANESIHSNESEGLKLLNKKSKLFQNVKPLSKLGLNSFSIPSKFIKAFPKKTYQNQKAATSYQAIERTMTEMVIDDMGAMSVYMNDRFDILHARGDVRTLMKQPDSVFSANLLQLVPRNVGLAIRNATLSAKSSGEKVKKTGIRLSREEEDIFLNLTVSLATTLEQVGQTSDHYLVSLIPQQVIRIAALAKSDALAEDEDKDTRIAELENMVAQLQQELYSSMEAADLASEELQAGNEELVTANEELQSTNEELQSVNEELHTVNAELSGRNEDLSAINADMTNLFNSTDVGTLFLDRELRIRKFTPSVTKQFQLMDIDVGRPINQLAHNFKVSGQGKTPLIESINTTLLHGDVYSSEMQMVDEKWYMMKAFPFLDKGQIEGIILNFVDINELKQAEERYKYQSSAFEQVLEGTMAGYWDWMIQEGTEYLSPSFKAMFGYEDHEMENTPEAWQNIIHPDDLPGVFECFENHVSSKGEIPYDSTVRYYHKDGSIVWVYCRGKVIEWAEDGQPIRMVGSHVNVTELIEAKTALEKTNEELREFSYVASHDLKAPLRHIQNLSQWIMEDDADRLSEQSLERLKNLNSRAIRLSSLLDAMVTFSKAGATGQKIELLSVADAVSEVVNELHPPKKFSINVECTDCMLQTSPFMLRIVLQNLISNSIKHNDKEEGQVTIRCQTSDQEVKIQIADNGPGIPSEAKESIFGLFTQLKPKDVVEGSGMGLAIVEKFVRHCHGKVELESEEGKGSTFTVVLPLTTPFGNKS